LEIGIRIRNSEYGVRAVRQSGRDSDIETETERESERAGKAGTHTHTEGGFIGVLLSSC